MKAIVALLGSSFAAEVWNQHSTAAISYYSQIITTSQSELER